MTRRFPLGLVPIVAGLALAACSQARPARIGAADTNCTRCHGQPPDTDAHAVHVTFAQNLLKKQGGVDVKAEDTCFECHKDVQGIADPDHILRANGDPVPSPAEVRFDQRSAIYGVTSQANATEPGASRAGAPSFDATSRTCSNVYCHGSTLLGATGNLITQPNWASKGQVVCGSCHAIPPGDAPHAGLTPGDRTACARCHVGAIDADGNAIANLHVNGVVNVAADGGCNRCHGRTDLAQKILPNDPRSAPPVDTLGQSDSVAVGAHQAHLTESRWRSAPIACADCHVVPNNLLDPGHIDGNVTVPFGALAKTGGTSPAYDFTTHQCSNVYCHGAFRGGAGTSNKPAWDGAGTAADCGTCHALPPPVSAGHPATGSGSGQDGLPCGQCHPGYTFVPGTPPTGGVNPALHINGQVDRQ